MKFKSLSVLLLLASLFFTSTPKVFGQYFFGRNKIQYDKFDWKILTTEHFNVYFYPEMAELAEIGAAFAEEAYARLEAKTNHNITKKIPLIFYSNHSHFQQTNTTPGFIPEGVGGFFEFLKGRVVIPSTGSIHSFKHVINHEMVHVFTRSKMHRVLKDHRKTSHAGMPLWFTEGIAEYWSEGWDSQAEMIIRDAVLNGHLVPLAQMDRIYGSFLMYKEGQAICNYISEKFGEEKLLQLIENVWKEARFSDVMKLTIGVNYKEFDEQWTYYLKKKKYPLLKDGDSPKMVTKTITKGGISTKPAVYEKYGRKSVVFTSNRVGYSNIYLKPLLQSEEEGKSKASILVKGERTSDFESFYLLRSKLHVSADGRLAFISKSGAKDALYIFDIEEKRILQKQHFEDLVSLSSPNWSPDATKIAFTGVTFEGLNDLYIFDLKTKELRRLTNDFYNDRDPAWSPDGGAIAFSSDRGYFGKDGHLNLFLYRLHNGSIEYLTNGPHNDNSPAWSPDGNGIAFSSDRDDSFNIWVIKNTDFISTPLTEVVVASLRHEKLERSKNNGVSNGVETVFGYPSAVDSRDQIKKITHFTTGAFDPVWLDDDNLLVTAFENFSFQIRQIEGIEEKLEEAPLAQNDALATDVEHWNANKLAGAVTATTIKYKKRLSLDIAQSAISHDPVFGSSGGAQLAMSDMLGNQQYYFLLFNNSQRSSSFLSSWNVAVTRVERAGRVNYAIGGYRLTGRFFDRVESFFQRDQVGGFVAASYPFSVFNRIEASINLRKEKREYDTRGEIVNGIVISNSLSYVKDNSIWGFTGPIDGERYNFTVGHTLDLQNNDVNFYTFTADYRKYFRLSRRTTYAVRLMTRLNIGKEAFRYFMGGSWDLRLYPRWTIWGRKLFLINNELRMPFLDRFILGFPFGGFGFNAIRGAAFVDLGQAWDRDYEFNEVLGSVGFGWRLRFGGFLVLRYEIGKTFQIRDFSSPNIRFDKGLKKAFWFGVDF